MQALWIRDINSSPESFAREAMACFQTLGLCSFDKKLKAENILFTTTGHLLQHYLEDRELCQDLQMDVVTNEVILPLCALLYPHLVY